MLRLVYTVLNWSELRITFIGPYNWPVVLVVLGKIMIDYIADYLETIRERRVYPNVHPGYLRNLTPDCAPVEPESWDHIMDDVENIIMPGVRDYSVETSTNRYTRSRFCFRSHIGNRPRCTRTSQRWTHFHRYSATCLRTRSTV